MVRTGCLRTSDRRTRLLGTGAKQRGEQVPESFTALFTARGGGALGNRLPGHKTGSGGLITAPGLMTPAPVL